MMMDQFDAYKEELSKRESAPEHPHWFCGENDDEGLTYCYGCTQELRPSVRFGIDLCGGYPGYAESDGSEHCEKCGRLLSYTLTDYGVKEQLGYFLESGFDWNNPNDCFELARVAYGIVTSNRVQVSQLLYVVKHGRNAPEIVTA